MRTTAAGAKLQTGGSAPSANMVVWGIAFVHTKHHASAEQNLRTVGQRNHENNNGRRKVASRGQRTVCKYGGVRYWY